MHRPAFLVLIPALYAQIDRGTFVGLVSDPQSAPVPNATVEIRGRDTNVTRQVTTSSTGEYNSLPLQPGRYTVSIKMQGFREKFAEVTLAVGQRLQFDVQLDIGAVTDRVNVSASAATIETATSEIGQTRQAKEIFDLPLITRNFWQLAPGVVTGDGGASGLLGGTSDRGASGATINGASVEGVTYMSTASSRSTPTLAC